MGSLDGQPEGDFCYRFVRRFSDTVGIAGSHGRLGDWGSTNTEQVLSTM